MSVSEILNLVLGVTAIIVAVPVAIILIIITVTVALGVAINVFDLIQEKFDKMLFDIDCNKNRVKEVKEKEHE